jgi:hypothetical protein
MRYEAKVKYWLFQVLPQPKIYQEKEIIIHPKGVEWKDTSLFGQEVKPVKFTTEFNFDFMKAVFNPLGWDVVDCQYYRAEKGYPDFELIRNGEVAYVELKKSNDSIRIDQMMWHIKNKEKDVYYLVIDEITGKHNWDNGRKH